MPKYEYLSTHAKDGATKDLFGYYAKSVGEEWEFVQMTMFNQRMFFLFRRELKDV